MLKLHSPEILFNKRKIYRQTAIDNSLDVNELKAVLVYENQQSGLPQTQKEMLEKMMAACKFSPQDVAYINASEANTSLATIQRKYKPVAVLVFGDLMLGRNLGKLKKNVGIEISGMKVMQTESLPVLEKNGDAKKKLWIALQQMLNLA